MVSVWQGAWLPFLNGMIPFVAWAGWTSLTGTEVTWRQRWLKLCWALAAVGHSYRCAPLALCVSSSLICLDLRLWCQDEGPEIGGVLGSDDADTGGGAFTGGSDGWGGSLAPGADLGDLLALSLSGHVSSPSVVTSRAMVRLQPMCVMPWCHASVPCVHCAGTRGRSSILCRPPSSGAAAPARRTTI